MQFARADADLVKSLETFSLTNVHGETVALDDYAGKVVLVNFWASWCPPCVEEFPSLQALRTHYEGSAFEILAINMGESPEDIETFNANLAEPANFPLLVDQDISVAKRWKVKGLPTTILLDPSAREILRYVGDRDWNDAQTHAQVDALLAQ